MAWVSVLILVLGLAAIWKFTDWIIDKAWYSDGWIWNIIKWVWIILLVTTILWGVSQR